MHDDLAISSIKNGKVLYRGCRGLAFKGNRTVETLAPTLCILDIGYY
jgi:hypothetical protein